MTIAKMKKKHDGKVCICRPLMRDASSKQVKSWTVLQSVTSLDECRKALAYYEKEGIEDAVPISCNDAIEIKEELAAKYFRVFFGMQS